jgi:hypothetical protein
MTINTQLKEAIQSGAVKNPTKPIKTDTKDSGLINKLCALISIESEKLAAVLGIDPKILQLWLSDYTTVPTKIMLTFLHIGIQYHLNPLNNEIALTMYEDEQWQAIVTVDGLYKLINREPHFGGMTFTESPGRENDIPIWMECTIYRQDRIHPLVIREYFDEVKNQLSSWEKMPRRMLRHRTLQQCARAAFGLTGLATHVQKHRELKQGIRANEINKGDLQAQIKLTRTEQLKGSLLGIYKSNSQDTLIPTKT